MIVAPARLPDICLNGRKDCSCQKQSLWLFGAMLCGVAFWASCTAKECRYQSAKWLIAQKRGSFLCVAAHCRGRHDDSGKSRKDSRKVPELCGALFPEETAIPGVTRFLLRLVIQWLIIRAEPDPDEIFMVKIKGHWLEDKNADLSFSSGGVLTKAKAETTNRTLDVVLQAAQTATSLASQAWVFAPIFREEETHSRKFRSVGKRRDRSGSARITCLEGVLAVAEGKSGQATRSSRNYSSNALVEDANKR
ncbi:MAG: hypothetical protein U0X75_10815 [Acidobacteriota bacterium]